MAIRDGSLLEAGAARTPWSQPGSTSSMKRVDPVPLAAAGAALSDDDDDDDAIRLRPDAILLLAPETLISIDMMEEVRSNYKGCDYSTVWHVPLRVSFDLGVCSVSSAAGQSTFRYPFGLICSIVTCRYKAMEVIASTSEDAPCPVAWREDARLNPVTPEFLKLEVKAQIKETRTSTAQCAQSIALLF